MINPNKDQNQRLIQKTNKDQNQKLQGGDTSTNKLGDNIGSEVIPPGRNMLGTWFGETGLNIQPEVFPRNNCEQI